MRSLLFLSLSLACHLAFAQSFSVYNEIFHCPEHPSHLWHSSEMLSNKLSKAGYQIEKISSTTGGCYEVQGRSPNGQTVRLQIDPITLRPLKTESR